MLEFRLTVATLVLVCCTGVAQESSSFENRSRARAYS